MNYQQYTIQCEPELSEILIALLGEYPFDTFEEIATGFKAFIPEKADTEVITQALSDLREQFDFSYSKEFIPYQNWNELWELNFSPIVIDDFCGIRADFHAPIPNVQYEMVINPKMAFGTGHHETTFSMIKAMKNIDFKDKKVFDYGTGTGILAILASMLGAKEIDANDVEFPAYENTIENCNINNILNVNAFYGDLSVMKATNYDIILANINRNVLLDSMSALRNLLIINGFLFLSGFLEEDELVMTECLFDNKFSIVEKTQKGKWLCMVVQKQA